MGFLRKVSDSNIQCETLLPIHATPQQAIGATVAAKAEPDHNRSQKKRKRSDNLSINSAVSALNEISDDSDQSSDEEKYPQKSLLGSPKQRSLRPETKKRKKDDDRRRVLFGDSISTKYYAATLTKTELRDLKKDLWFTKQDRLQSQAECMEVIKTFRIQNAEEVMRFSDVYRTSMQIPFSQESSDFLERATVSIPLTIRGIEWGIAPKLKKRRKEHIQSVLALQGHISDVELRERFVSSRSLQSSRPARIIARMIGEGDASASKFGTASRALNITTVPMKTTKKTATETTSFGRKLPLLKQQRHNRVKKEVGNQTETKNEISCGYVTTKKKLGHARRRRRPILWRKVA
mmetsp:Transcript_5531/g.13869  ORF Transcript_5531/g.13869 Transcript_5531/m.13869 type:complete len:349 (-) Transcript_5531:223-1269(-)